MTTKSIIFLSVFFVCTLFANFFFKQGAVAIGPVTFSMESLTAAFSSPAVLIGAAFYLVAAIAWFVSLSVVPLNIAVSVSALLYVGIIFIAHLAFHEPIPPARWIGIVLIAIGIYVIGRTA